LLNVSERDVTIVAGQTHPEKIALLARLTLEEVRARLGL
jgi:uncharacterized protein YggU (UPF0235/DUF167 family)